MAASNCSSNGGGADDGAAGDSHPEFAGDGDQEALEDFGPIAFNNYGRYGDSLIICDLVEAGYLSADLHVVPE